MEQEETPRKLCSNCQNEIAEGNFCSKCGQAQNDLEVQIYSKKWLSLLQAGLFILIQLVLCICAFLIQETSITITLALDFAMAGTAMAFFTYNWSENKPLLRWPNFSLKKLLAFVALAAMASLTLHFIANYINTRFLHEKFTYFDVYKSHEYGRYIMILSMAIFPAVFEELSFRGYLMQKLLIVVGEKEAIYISSFLFFIIHLNVLSFFWLLPFAIILGHIRIKEKTIWYGVAIHFIFNLTTCLVEFFNIDHFIS